MKEKQFVEALKQITSTIGADSICNSEDIKEEKEDLLKRINKLSTYKTCDKKNKIL